MTKPQPITIHTQTIILTRDGQNNGTLDTIGIKMYVLAALKEH